MSVHSNQTEIYDEDLDDATNLQLLELRKEVADLNKTVSKLKATNESLSKELSSLKFKSTPKMVIMLNFAKIVNHLLNIKVLQLEEKIETLKVALDKKTERDLWIEEKSGQLSIKLQEEEDMRKFFEKSASKKENNKEGWRQRSWRLKDKWMMCEFVLEKRKIEILELREKISEWEERFKNRKRPKIIDEMNSIQEEINISNSIECPLPEMEAPAIVENGTKKISLVIIYSFVQNYIDFQLMDLSLDQNQENIQIKTCSCGKASICNGKKAKAANNRKAKAKESKLDDEQLKIIYCMECWREFTSV